MVFLYNITIKYIISNHIPLETVICDDRDPRWTNSRVKELINEKNDTCQCYLHSNKDAKLFNKVEYIQNEFKFLTEADKERFYSRISGHFSIIKRFLAFRHCFIKIGMLISKKIMLNYLINVFTNICSVINNASVLPSFLFKPTENVISSINFSSDVIAKINQKLDPSKAYGHNMISIRMLILWTFNLQQLICVFHYKLIHFF